MITEKAREGTPRHKQTQGSRPFHELVSTKIQIKFKTYYGTERINSTRNRRKTH